MDREVPSVVGLVPSVVGLVVDLVVDLAVVDLAVAVASNKMKMMMIILVTEAGVWVLQQTIQELHSREAAVPIF